MGVNLVSDIRALDLLDAIEFIPSSLEVYEEKHE
jgi:hypothetical protein